MKIYLISLIHKSHFQSSFHHISLVYAFHYNLQELTFQNSLSINPISFQVHKDLIQVNKYSQQESNQENWIVVPFSVTRATWMAMSNLPRLLHPLPISWLWESQILILILKIFMQNCWVKINKPKSTLKQYKNLLCIKIWEWDRFNNQVMDQLATLLLRRVKV